MKSKTHKRPSILDKVVLRDGRNAWQVAQSVGMSEVTFRDRLKRMAPDDAISLPVRASKRGPNRSTRMRQAAEKRVMSEAREAAKRLPQLAASKPDIKAPRINMRSSSYWGTIAQAEGERIAVHASGSSYLYQTFDAGTGQWITARAVPSASILCRCLVQSPAGLMDAAQRLPDAPSAYVWSSRNGESDGADLSSLSGAAEDAGGWDGRQAETPVGELPHMPSRKTGEQSASVEVDLVASHVAEQPMSPKPEGGDGVQSKPSAMGVNAMNDPKDKRSKHAEPVFNKRSKRPEPVFTETGAGWLFFALAVAAVVVIMAMIGGDGSGSGGYIGRR